MAFIERARELYPAAHVRLYTCGDLLDDACLGKLAQAGLDEVRFSVKPEDVANAAAPVFDRMAAAVSSLPRVVVEMPVIPGTLPAMKSLLSRLGAMGVRGINLLEFCFPLCNAEDFRARGFELRKHPFNYLYDYWYGGGVPVAGSEVEALALLEYADEQQLELGIHYCSSDNKNTGQIFQQNKTFLEDADLQAAYPRLSLDEGDKLLKCAKAFGKDAKAVRAWARACHVPHDWDAKVPSVAIPLEYLGQAGKAYPGAVFAESANVFEDREGQLYLRELGVRAIKGEEGA